MIDPSAAERSLVCPTGPPMYVCTFLFLSVSNLDIKKTEGGETKKRDEALCAPRLIFYFLVSALGGYEWRRVHHVCT